MRYGKATVERGTTAQFIHAMVVQSCAGIL